MDVAGLCYICASAGFIMIVGSLFLIGKRIIYIDAATGQITDIKLPLGIRVKTNLPVILMLLFGVFMLAFPIYMFPKAIAMRRLNVPVTSPSPVKVFAVVDEDQTDGVRNAVLSIPDLPNVDFSLVYLLANLDPLKEKIFPAEGPPRGINIINKPVQPPVDVPPPQLESSQVVDQYK